MRSRLSKSFYSSAGNPEQQQKQQNRKNDNSSSSTSQAIRSSTSTDKVSNEKLDADSKSAVAIKAEKLKKRSKLCLLL